MYSVGSVAKLISGSDTPSNKKMKSQPNTPNKKMKSQPNTPNKKLKSQPNTPNKKNKSESNTPDKKIKSEKNTPNKKIKSEMNTELNTSNKKVKTPVVKVNIQKKTQKKMKKENKSIKVETEKKSKNGTNKLNKKMKTTNDTEKQEQNEENGHKSQGVKRKAETKIKTIIEKKVKYDTPEKADRTIFVGNVPLNTTEKELKTLFSKYGKIESLRFRGIPRADIRQSKKIALFKKNFSPNRTSMIAYVVFENAENAIKATEVNGQIFKEHYIRVNMLFSTDPANKENSIFVGNLPFDAEDNDLIELFKDCGAIDSVRIARDRNTMIGRGFGFVNFQSSDGVELAMQMEDIQLKNRLLRIKRSDNRKVKEESKSWKSIKIDNIPINKKRSFLMNVFKKCGFITNITFHKNPFNNQIKTAVISFETASNANFAMNVRLSINNQPLFIKKDVFDPCRLVYLKNVPLKTENNVIEEALKECGKIKYCNLKFEPKEPVGYGMVEFETIEAAENAIKLENIQIKNEVIDISTYGKKRKEKPKIDEDEENDADETNEEENSSDADDDDDDSDNEEMEQDKDDSDDEEMEQEDDEADDDDDDDVEADDDDDDVEAEDDDDSNDDGADDDDDDDDDDEEDDDE